MATRTSCNATNDNAVANPSPTSASSYITKNCPPFGCWLALSAISPTVKFSNRMPHAVPPLSACVFTLAAQGLLPLLFPTPPMRLLLHTPPYVEDPIAKLREDGGVADNYITSRHRRLSSSRRQIPVPVRGLDANDIIPRIHEAIANTNIVT